ncbi:MAG: hypothetical protein E7609_03715 [Ruminococcaceae bacterium]|nr:hypothetical protein [Oscillospiraceae bacterium]
MNDQINESALSESDTQSTAEAGAKEPDIAASESALENEGPSTSPAIEEEIDYERLASEDLAEIKRLDPAYAPAAHLGELPFARRFAELRDLGLSVKEALAAAAPRFERHDGRAHLRAVVPRGTRAPEDTLDRDRMKEAKQLFGGLSEAEINALYRRVSKRNDD